MHNERSLHDIQREWHGTLKSYAIGFIGSIILTVISFFMTSAKILSGRFLAYTLVGLALIQAVIQLRYFLHLGQETKPRWETIIFYFMFLVLLIIALGSLWIMYDLNDRVMSDMAMGMTHD
ncbi:cytochrome o ubiquinol oxidase subunit IV [Parachlamydia acanthamoebae]|uniref:Cytochrome bo(3) ubiquinol oxidase subunit 4 n=3 Tax=Parachlamydia TaxID=83551 RepID=F8KUU3_PARAV|nr:cytochrome o ubiquinol oxidase subunit IV [Parachlamydia acanthamoebae]KIA76527.1 Cytochrome o ubiquinol oxidase protein CyoD [Parachlamydia acanthamoebae]CCB85008.1 cytochrome o ubiquinol oxidase protein CyoD [Parachlamydia acanthamoebae UV-7]